MKKLLDRAKNVIFKFDLEYSEGKWKTHPVHLDYEDGKYRDGALTKIIQDAVAHFALTQEEFDELVKQHGDVGGAVRQAWSRISKARKDKKGDFGEILLFIILKLFFPESERFVTKVRLRSSTKTQINGFDCAHFTVEDGEIVLWLGEAKFHQSYSTAVTEAITSIKDHVETAYLKDEISILHSNVEINRDYPDYEKLKGVLDGSRSLDTLKFKIPVLLTYDSSEVKKHGSATTQEFAEKMKEEFIEKFKKLDEQDLTVKPNFEIIFIVFPLQSVKEIKDDLEKIEEASR
jgi:hypothetical protein